MAGHQGSAMGRALVLVVRLLLMAAHGIGMGMVKGKDPHAAQLGVPDRAAWVAVVKHGKHELLLKEEEAPSGAWHVEARRREPPKRWAPAGETTVLQKMRSWLGLQIMVPKGSTELPPRGAAAAV